MADLYGMLAEALSRPSEDYLTAQEGINALKSVAQGYVTGQEIGDRMRARRFATKQMRNVMSGAVPYGLAPETSVEEFATLAPLLKEKNDLTDTLLKLSVANQFREEAQKRQNQAVAERQQTRIEYDKQKTAGAAKQKLQSALTGLAGTEKQANDLFTMYDNIQKQGKVTQAYGLRGRFYENPRANLSMGNIPGTSEIYAFNQLADGLIARLRGFTGDVGVLTERDAERLRGLLPKIGENPDVSRRKLAQIKSLLALSKAGNLEQMNVMLRQIGIKQESAPWDYNYQEPGKQTNIYLDTGSGGGDINSIYSGVGL